MAKKLRKCPSQWNIQIDPKYTKELQYFTDRYSSLSSRLWEHLRWNPDRVIPSRVFPLKGKKYRHAWEYKEIIPEGTFRLFFQLHASERIVLVYYVGPKPNKAPLPPY